MSLTQKMKALLDDFRRRGDTLDRRMIEVCEILEGFKAAMGSDLAALKEQFQELAKAQSLLQEQLGNLQQQVSDLSLVPTPAAPSPDNVQENMPYYSLTVQDCTYFYNCADKIIPCSMINSGVTFAENTMVEFFELANRYHYKGSIPEAGRFLEIGANIGTTTVFFKKKLTPQLKFLAFEPVLDNARLLAANCAINGIMDDVCIVHGALSDRESESARIFVVDDNRGGSVLIAPETNHDVFETCITMTLDGYLKDHGGAEDICYAWIDTESHEYQVLSGAKETFRRRIPTCLEYNQGSYKSGGIYDSMLNLLNELFDCFIVLNIPDKSVRPISELPMLWDEFEGRSCDLFLF